MEYGVAVKQAEEAAKLVGTALGPSVSAARAKKEDQKRFVFFLRLRLHY